MAELRRRPQNRGLRAAPYWYPTQSRAEELAKELGLFAGVSAQQLRHSVKFLPLISQTLSTALNAEGFPQHQIGQWVWLASQFVCSRRQTSGQLPYSSARLSIFFASAWTLEDSAAAT